MGIDITQWRIEIAKYVKFLGRRRHSRGEIPRSENCLSHNLQPPVGTHVVILPHYGSLLAISSGRRREEPWTSQATE